MLKIKDNVNLKELEKYGYTKHKMEKAAVDYYKFTKLCAIQIFKDRSIHYQLPIGSPLKVIIIENFIQDLIKADLVEKVDQC